MRWALALQGYYDYKVESIPRKDNVVANVKSDNWLKCDGVYILCAFACSLCTGTG